MEAIEFACVMDKLSKSLKIDLDPDLVGEIHSIYEGSYENYTLLELIGLLRKNKIKITCAWNKKAIIAFIEENKYNIPKKYEPMEPTKWEHYRIRRSLDVIDTENIEFYEGSMVKMPDGEDYLIDVNKWGELISEDLDQTDPDSWVDVIYVYLENIKTKEEICMYAEEFIECLDYEDVTILQDRNTGYFLNDEQKTRWENHVRYM